MMPHGVNELNRDQLVPYGNNKHGLDNDLLPDYTKPLPEPMLTKTIHILGYFTYDFHCRKKETLYSRRWGCAVGT